MLRQLGDWRYLDTGRRLGCEAELFLRDGYAATSLEKVAEAAGYSKGAVYSNFRNKDELCLAALDRIHQQRAEQIAQAPTSSDSLDERLTAFQGWVEDAIGDQDWTALEVEFAIAARRDPGLIEALAERDKLIRAMLAEWLETNAKELDLPLPMPAEDAATALLSLGSGSACSAPSTRPSRYACSPT